MTSGNVRVAVAGSRGRTGSAVAAALAQSPGMSVVGHLVREGADPMAKQYADLAALAAATKPDALVDFTVFPSSKAIALQAISLGIRPVVGTSGYRAADIEALRAACEAAKLGGVYAANFSLGAVLMMQFAALAARHFNYAEIVETHHAGKKDAPSGTALATARRIASAGKFNRPAAEIVKAEGARGAQIDGVGIHSLRLPGVISDQEVVFANDGEMLVIRHSTSSQTAFFAGVVTAVHAVMKLDHLIEGLEELM